jgi:hypothetical protein
MKKVIIVVVICVVIAGVLTTISDYAKLRKQIMSGTAVAVALTHPARGTPGGTYAYDVSLNTTASGGTVDPASAITRIVVKGHINAVIHPPSTTTPGFNAATSPAAKSGINNAFVSGSGSNPVNLTYDADANTVSYIDREMEVTITSPFKMFFFFTGTATIVYTQLVPAPTPNGESGND